MSHTHWLEVTSVTQTLGCFPFQQCEPQSEGWGDEQAAFLARLCFLHLAHFVSQKSRNRAVLLL